MVGSSHLVSSGNPWDPSDPVGPQMMLVCQAVNTKAKITVANCINQGHNLADMPRDALDQSPWVAFCGMGWPFE